MARLVGVRTACTPSSASSHSSSSDSSRSYNIRFSSARAATSLPLSDRAAHVAARARKGLRALLCGAPNRRGLQRRLGAVRETTPRSVDPVGAASLQCAPSRRSRRCSDVIPSCCVTSLLGLSALQRFRHLTCSSFESPLSSLQRRHPLLLCNIDTWSFSAAALSPFDLLLLRIISFGVLNSPSSTACRSVVIYWL